MLASGKKARLDQHGDDQDGDAEIADQPVDVVDQREQRLGDEIEPAPVDQQIEVVEVELLLVVVDDAHFLGAGEQPRIRGGAGARRDGAPVEQVVGLIGLQRAELVGAEMRHHMRVGLGQQRRGPVFVGDAEPAHWWRRR